MDYLILVIAFSTVWILIRALNSAVLSRRNSPAAPLPPGPPRLPVLGNLVQLRGGSPYQTLSAFAKTYGPVMSLKLGTVTTVVFSTADAAKEVLSKHDAVFADRATRHVIKALDHHKASVIWSPASANWRNLRKILMVQMFVTHRLNASQHLRLQKVQQLREHLRQRSRSGGAVDVGGAVFTTLLNMISITMFSVDLAGYCSKESQEFERLVLGVMDEGARPNMADLFPALQWIDPNGGRKRMTLLCEKLMGYFEKFINERSQAASSSLRNNDVLDALLNPSLGKDYQLSLNDLKHLFLDIFVGGIDTTASMLEWAMAELLHNPKKLAKARIELQETLDEDGQIQESDISKLPYLQAVVKETLRLHPPGPLLVPRKAMRDVEICGFKVPKNAQILVNVWAISRDPNSWSNPNSFYPERFLESKIDFKGRDFEFLPFGAGRRICPGLSLAHRMMHTILATFIHFDWKLDGGMKPKDMNMNEKNDFIFVKRAEPLWAIPVKA